MQTGTSLHKPLQKIRRTYENLTSKFKVPFILQDAEKIYFLNFFMHNVEK